MVQLDFKSDYICTYKNVLNKQQCQHLIDKFEDSPTQQTKTIVDNHMSFTEINISMHNDWKEYTSIIFPKLRQVIDKYTKDVNIDNYNFVQGNSLDSLENGRYFLKINKY